MSSTTDCNAKSVNIPYIELSCINDARTSSDDDDCISNKTLCRTKIMLMVGISIVVVSAIGSVVSNRRTSTSWASALFDTIAFDNNVAAMILNPIGTKNEDKIHSDFERVGEISDELIGSKSPVDDVDDRTKDKKAVLRKSGQSPEDIIEHMVFLSARADDDNNNNLKLIRRDKVNVDEHSDVKMLNELLLRSVENEKQRANLHEDDTTVTKKQLREIPLRSVDISAVQESVVSKNTGEYINKNDKMTKEILFRTVHNENKADSETEGIAYFDDDDVNTNDEYYRSFMVGSVDNSNINIEQENYLMDDDTVFEMAKKQNTFELDEYYRTFIGIDNRNKSNKQRNSITASKNSKEDRMAQEMVEWSLKKEKTIRSENQQKRFDSVPAKMISQETVRSMKESRIRNDSTKKYVDTSKTDHKEGMGKEQKMADEMVQWSLKKDAAIRYDRKNDRKKANLPSTTDEEEKMAQEMIRWSIKRGTELQRSNGATNDENRMADEMVRWSLKKESAIRHDQKINKVRVESSPIEENENMRGELVQRSIKKEQVKSENSDVAAEMKMADEMVRWSLKKESTIRHDQKINNMRVESSPTVENENMQGELVEKESDKSVNNDLSAEMKMADEMVRWSLKKESAMRNDQLINNMRVESSPREVNEQIQSELVERFVEKESAKSENNDLSAEMKMADEMVQRSLKKESVIRHENNNIRVESSPTQEKEKMRGELVQRSFEKQSAMSENKDISAEMKMANDMVRWSVKKESAIRHGRKINDMRVVSSPTQESDKVRGELVQRSVKKESVKSENKMDDVSAEMKMADEMVRRSLKKESVIRHGQKVNDMRVESSPTQEDEKMRGQLVQRSFEKESAISENNNDVSTEMKMADEMVRWSLKKEYDRKVNNLRMESSPTEEKEKMRGEFARSFATSNRDVSAERKMADDMVRWSMEKESVIRNEQKENNKLSSYQKRRNTKGNRFGTISTTKK